MQDAFSPIKIKAIDQGNTVRFIVTNNREEQYDWYIELRNRFSTEDCPYDYMEYPKLQDGRIMVGRGWNKSSTVPVSVKSQKAYIRKSVKADRTSGTWYVRKREYVETYLKEHNAPDAIVNKFRWHFAD
tara:strand:- start:786 stop:1172 length:387 start_codon:yes stop_codon:yes gene_type:complete